MIVRKIGNVTVYDDFKFSDSMNRVENLRIDLKQTFINQLIFAAMYIGISFFIMIFTVGYVHEITYLIIVLIALGTILRDWLKLKGKSRVIRGEYQKDEWSIFSGQVKLRILQYIVIKVNYMSECRME